jgi:serine/threonine protein kinase/tetratricopeptide (TPR) repeat protein
MSTPREKAVFCEALEITDPAQRRQFLDQACGADKALREGVERLLALSQSAGDFFSECRPALEAAAADADSARVPLEIKSALEAEPCQSSRIGPYKLLQKLGEGGCGVVYMAEQEQPIRRRVALKIIKLGMDTRNVIARFEAERQALALMDHPNIARVLDAGATETGRPYFVMELVYGVKITDYCDQNRLSMQERLELFVQVCNAIQHAHQKGIIHRDLKPSNIMVTMHDGVPVPKVIDFGIAKATEQRLTDKTLFTSYAQLMGTPAYMSPEQMELSGLNLDTRSDIYSLGVLLYELLTGRTPFDTAGLLKLGVDELRRTLREQEPLSPSAKLKTLNIEELAKTARRHQVEAPRLVSQLRGDLDWIVLKCLEKDRTRRYATANGLAMEIDRYLHEETVVARPPSQLYRLQKLVRRNRIVFLFGAAAVAFLLLGTIFSTLMFFKEREARTSEARLRREAELREKASHVAMLVTQRRFEEADKLVAGLPLIKPSIEVASELRALGDWHATKGRWPQAAERFGSLAKVNQLDDPDVTSLDQLRLTAALLEAGDRHGYEQWRQSLVARFTPPATSLSPSIMKACLLLRAESNLLQWLAAASEVNTIRNGSVARIRPTARQAVAWSDAKVLLEYRRGDFAETTHQRFLADNAPRLATFALIQTMAAWQLKDYWGAMITWTKGYALVQAGARQGQVTLTVATQVFPGISEPDYLRASWYDWAVADLLLRECDEMIGEAEQSVRRMPARTPSLKDVAILRAAGERHALRGEWSDALRCSQYCLQSNQQDSLDHATMDYLNAAIASLQLGDENGYLRLCEEIVTRYKDPEEKSAERALEVGLMRPLDDRTAARLEPFAALLSRASQKQPTQNDTKHSMTLAVYEYRRGNYRNAMDAARRSVANVPGVALPNAMERVISAMALQHLGDRSAARLELEHAKNLIETGFDLEFDMWHWRDWVLVRLLLREADGLISQPPLPASSATVR